VQFLEHAMQAANPEVLGLAVNWAEEAGVSADTIATACGRKEALDEEAQRNQSLEAVAAALAAALQQGDAAVLGAAIAAARRAGISQETIKLAERKRAMLETLAAESLLQSAMGGSDTGALASAIEHAAEAGVKGEAVEKARRNMAERADVSRRQLACGEAAKELKSAMLQGDAESLTLAIDRAVQAGVSREVVARARRKLARASSI